MLAQTDLYGQNSTWGPSLQSLAEGLALLVLILFDKCLL